MKISIMKLKGRGYLIGNLLLLSLLFFTVILFSVCINILPEMALQLLSTVPQNITNIITLFVCVAVILFLFCIFSAADMGLIRFFLRKAQKKGGKAKDLFFYFSPKQTAKLISFSVKTALLKFFILCICFMPFCFGSFLLFSLIKNSASLSVSVVMLLSTLCFLLNGIVFYSLADSSLFLLKYYFANGEYLNFRHLVSSSQTQMKKHRRTLLKLRLSFMGWFLSCVFILPIGYVFSYFSQSKAVAASHFMAD